MSSRLQILEMFHQKACFWSRALTREYKKKTVQHLLVLNVTASLLFHDMLISCLQVT